MDLLGKQLDEEKSKSAGIRGIPVPSERNATGWHSSNHWNLKQESAEKERGPCRPLRAEEDDRGVVVVP